jgi:hypothetical protein
MYGYVKISDMTSKFLSLSYLQLLIISCVYYKYIYSISPHEILPAWVWWSISYRHQTEN